MVDLTNEDLTVAKKNSPDIRFAFAKTDIVYTVRKKVLRP